MKLPIAYYGNPVLRKKAQPVVHFDDELKQLVEDMYETMKENNGCGLAAPQVNRSLAVFVTCIPEYDEEGKLLNLGQPRVYVNPKILSYSSETWTCSEGCISIPGLRENVERPYSIAIQAQDLEGNTFEEEFHEFDARCFMHENDHINGVLYVDRIAPKRKNAIEQELRKIKKQYA